SACATGAATAAPGEAAGSAARARCPGRAAAPGCPRRASLAAGLGHRAVRTGAHESSKQSE
ncbi:MAG TPA: hypothetical protein VM686_09955, partial [Polyangiaceae bacterium]|nr:hypothetical protein [Polyangiaceae bacterium]